MPWQLLAARSGANLEAVALLEDGQVDEAHYRALLEGGEGEVALVACAQVSNALGTVLPLRSMIDAAHAVGALVLVDGAQARSEEHTSELQSH